MVSGATLLRKVEFRPLAIFFEPKEFAERQTAAKRSMAAEGLDGMIFFAQESHFYLTGFDTTGYVWFICGIMTAGADVYTLMVRMPDVQNAEITSVCEDIRVWDDTGTSNPARQLKDLLGEKGLAGGRVGIELFTHGLVAANYTKIQTVLEGFCELVDASHLVRKLRVVKSPMEITYIREASNIADRALAAMIEETRPGAFEGDIAAAGQSVILRAGGDVAPSGPTIGSGPRALSGRASSGPVHLGAIDQLTIEFAATYRRYNVCLMRTLPIGAVQPRQRELFEAVRESLEAAIGVARPGHSLADVYDAHQMVFDDRGLNKYRRPSCGYSLGATYRPTWMDVPPMIQTTNHTEVVPGMVLFLHAITMVPDENLAMSLGVTVLTGTDACEVLSEISLDLVSR